MPVGTPESKAAFESNLEAGLAQTLTAAGKMSAREDLVPDYSTIVGEATHVDDRAVAEGASHSAGDSGGLG